MWCLKKQLLFLSFVQNSIWPSWILKKCWSRYFLYASALETQNTYFLCVNFVVLYIMVSSFLVHSIFCCSYHLEKGITYHGICLKSQPLVKCSHMNFLFLFHGYWSNSNIHIHLYSMLEVFSFWIYYDIIISASEFWNTWQVAYVFPDFLASLSMLAVWLF